MTKAMCGVGLMLMISVAIALADQPQQREPVQAGRLSLQIGSAKPQLYQSIRDARDWRNPYLIIRREGIEVMARAVRSGSETVSHRELQRTLIELPVTAWPYGRVVGMQDIGIREAGDEQLIAENRKAALAILKALRVTVERWPS